MWVRWEKTKMASLGRNGHHNDKTRELLRSTVGILDFFKKSVIHLNYVGMDFCYKTEHI